MTNEQFKEWLKSPTGLLVMRVVQMILKTLLVSLSLKFPALGLGENVDVIIEVAAPVIALAICIIWTTMQHQHDEIKKGEMIAAAIGSKPQ